MSIATTAAPAPEANRQGRSLRLLVGVHDGSLSGVNTYVEHVAAAAATAMLDVTLLVAHDELAAEVGSRLEGVRVVSLRMQPITAGQRRGERLSPAYAAHRLATGLAAARPWIGAGYEVAHLNHPHLAAAVRPLAARVFVAAWFYPHSASGRAISTWRHSGRRFPRSVGLAVKGVLHHRNDARGYRAADTVVAPTRALADQLRRAGFDAVQCTPPARVLGDLQDAATDRRRPAGSAPRLLVCGGDLGHPRKNVGLALDALALLGARGERLELEVVGGNAGALRSRLAQLPIGVRVTVIGRLPAAEVHRRMRAADLLLVPSLFEEWGYVAVEAALQGTPVVTLPVYPFAEMLEPPLGFAASGLGAAEYAEAILAALQSSAGRRQVADMAELRFGLAAAGDRLAVIWLGTAGSGNEDGWLSSPVPGRPLQ
jgi:glycosyltransferase involved in cell wall biosynthesis